MELLKLHDFSVLIDNSTDNSTDNSIDKKNVIKRVNLSINAGDVHAIMGPNGSGKSSLAYAIMGHPSYNVTGGNLAFLGKILDGVGVNKVPVDERARMGMFLAFQYPYAISGATVFTVLKELYVQRIKKLVSVTKFSEILFGYMDMLSIDQGFASRNLNEGFSGGEKKKFEILQMLILKPKLVILDEIDSGLDIDALQVVSDGINHAKKKNPDMGILLITHYQRILRYIKPDFVHVMHNGEIKKSGDFTLVKQLELQGYKGL
ncbi:Fe-S cluster assembly ATPase SufC [Candidatus Dependentiae bacterium]